MTDARPPTSPRPSAVTQQTWPPERFYWAVVEAPGVRPRPGSCLPVGLLSSLADEVPVSVDELHAVAAPRADGHSVIVCAATRESLAAVPAGTLSLRPESLPPGLEADPSIFELLVGEFEPAPIRRSRVRTHAVALGSVTLVSLLAVIGLHRRANHWAHEAQQARGAAAQLATSQLPPGMPPEALAAEIVRVQQQSQSVTRLAPTPDAAVALAGLLRRWPTEIAAEPQSIGVQERSVSVSVLIEGDAMPFVRAVQAPEGWTLEEPRLNASGAFTRVALEFKRVMSGSASEGRR